MMQDPAETSGQPTPAPHSQGPLAGLVLVMVALSCYLTVLPVFAPRLQQHFSITNRQLGTLMACNVTGGLLALLVVLPVVARLGVRKATQFTAAGAGTGFLAAGLVRSLAAFEVGLLLIGLFSGALFIASMALLVDLYPAWKRRMVAITLAASSVPAILFPPAAQWALSRLVDTGRASLAAVVHWPMAAIGTALLGGACLASALARFDGSANGEAPSGVAWRRLLTAHTLLVLLLAALHGGADTSLYSWLPKYMTRQFAYHPIPPGLVLAAYSVAYLLARSLQAALPEGLGQRAFLVGAGPAGGLIVLAAIWRADALGLAILYPLAGLIWCLEFPALLADARTDSPGHFSGIVAGCQLASYLGAVGHLNLIGWLADRTGDFQLALTPAALSFVAFGLIAAIARLGKTCPHA